MAQATRTELSSELIAFLQREGPRGAFYQAVALLERLFQDAPALGEDGPASRERIRLRPSVSLAFPASDVESVCPTEQRVQITATFLGLYGADSPLPYAYSEHLAQISDERSGERVRAFLDIFHHRLYSLLYRAWRKARPVATSAEAAHPLYQRVLSALGYTSELGVETSRRPRLAEARMLVLRPRTAVGLEAFLRYRLGYPCRVAQLEERWVTLPPAELSRLGAGNCSLGSSLMIGRRLSDRSKLRLGIAATDYGRFEGLMPEGRDRRALDETVAAYLRQPIDYDVEVTLPTAQVPPWRLDARGALGRNCWLGSPRPHGVHRWSCRTSL